MLRKSQFFHPAIYITADTMSHAFYTIQKLVPASSSIGMFLLLYLASPTTAILILEVLSIARKDTSCELDHLAHFVGQMWFVIVLGSAGGITERRWSLSAVLEGK